VNGTDPHAPGPPIQLTRALRRKTIVEDICHADDQATQGPSGRRQLEPVTAGVRRDMQVEGRVTRVTAVVDQRLGSLPRAAYLHELRRRVVLAEVDAESALTFLNGNHVQPPVMNGVDRHASRSALMIRKFQAPIARLGKHAIGPSLRARRGFASRVVDVTRRARRRAATRFALR
jgi:hypothetical protein